MVIAYQKVSNALRFKSLSVLLQNHSYASTIHAKEVLMNAKLLESLLEESWLINHVLQAYLLDALMDHVNLNLKIAR